MAYYYFDFRDTDKQHRRGLLSSLLCQLCAVSDACYEILARLYSAHAGGTRGPSDGALTQCLMDMLQLEGRLAIYIIVDALDECPNSSGMPTPREKVLEFLKTSSIMNFQMCVYVSLAAQNSTSIPSLSRWPPSEFPSRTKRGKRKTSSIM